MAGSGEIVRIAEDRRATAPGVSGATLEGRPLALTGYRGKVVLLNVWGSWCAPCRAEAPGLERTYQALKDQGVEFVGINTRDLDRAPAQAFERRFGIGYPSLYDPEGALVLRFRGDLLPQAIPSTLVIDRQGRIAARALRALSEDGLRALLAPVVAEPS
ncbi:TlpA family protein disulfide reductase [Kitasatospora sp. NPDC098652]|uniref:TlpA family protein disulfide reductase n=1 Tax=Kitasatospora sp. NPDC098652 TaxID=3364095 RepID=UPI003822B5D6